ncbi:MAG: non-ribosomal peptide synthetase [Gammaproteobacteria bacterium]|nr:non-ribosomal peptide synthetase [Gammaproteobacteria bacterium]
MQYTTIIDALEDHLQSPHGVTFIESSDKETFVSYRQLHDNAMVLLHQFQEQGLQQGQHLILFINDNQSFLNAFWACLLGGIVPVPVAVGISDEHKAKLFRILSKLDQGRIFTDEKSFARLQQFLASAQAREVTNLSADQLKIHTFVAEQIKTASVSGVKAPVTRDSTAFIQFSSGSTSEPKGVVLTHGNLMANIEGIGASDKMNDSDRSLSWMPLTHDMGIIGFHINMMVYNVNQYLMSTDLFSRRPILWLAKVSEHKATLLSSPNFGYKHYLKSYTPEKAADLDLSSVRLIYNGAEPISVDLCDQFLDTMAAHGLRRSAMHTVYGLAEASLAVSFPDPDTPFKCVSIDRHAIKTGDPVRFLPRDHKDAASFAIEGKPIKNTEVKITGPDGQAVAEDVTGDVQIRGGNVTHGYYQNDAANAQAFTGDGWLKTGDTGFVHQGELIITGRSKEIIFVNGQNYFPHDLESIALLSPQLELGKVAAFGITQDVAVESALLMFVLFRGDLKEFIAIDREITSLVGEHLGLEVTHVIPVKRIPKTTSGKIQRSVLARQYLDGDFDGVLKQLAQLQEPSPSRIRQPDNSVEQQLLAICHNVIQDKILDLHTNLFEVGISSLALTEIHEQIDNAFPGKLEVDDLFEHPTLSALAELVKSRQ